MDLTELARLPLEERLRAMEALWESLCHDEPAGLSPDWHDSVLRERRVELAEKPLASLDDVETRLRQTVQRR